MQSVNIIQVENLTKQFKNLTAVDHISFEVKKGEIFGFLGPNGAGKSTTIGMLATLIAPTQGRALVNNFDVLSQRDEVRKSIGLVFQDPSLDDRLTAQENLHFHAKLYGVPTNIYPKREKEVLELVELWERRNEVIHNFSGGMKRRLEIARGLIHYPVVLFLDEPTLGLDPQTRAHLWDYILKLKHDRQMSIFMTTHYMQEAEYCDRIAIIDHGQIVALDTPSQLKKAVGEDIITLKSPRLALLKEELDKLDGFALRQKNGALYLEVDDGESFLPHLLREVAAPIDSVELRKPTLDDVFLRVTGRSIREEEASNKERMREQMRLRRR